MTSDEILSMKKYIQRNLCPVVMELLFIISCFIVPKDYYIYTNFLFYLALAVYFILQKQFSFSEWKKNVSGGRKFWIPVFMTALGFMAAFAITIFLEGVFPGLDDGMIGLKRDTWFKLLIFALSTIILPPVVEELFYRKSLIAFGNKMVMVLTTFTGLFLYALEHALSLWGILLVMIWALPLSISYIKTKNVYISMTAHFIVNFLGNGTDVIFTAIALLNRDSSF